MAEFLKTYPFITKDEYLYEMPIAQISIMSADVQHTKYLKKEEKEYIEKLLANKGLSNDVVVVSSINDFVNRNKPKK